VDGRLITVTNGTTVTVFTYDGDGKRVKQTVAPTTTVFIGNYCEIAISGTQRITTTYYYANGRRVAMRTAAGVTYIHSDHLGSTAVTSGAQSGDIKYFPYGATRSGAVSTAYKFTGQRLDDSTGLYYYGARYYDAAIGRFVQADSIVPGAGNPQALNRYSYVLNNPLKYHDPSGHWPIPPSQPLYWFFHADVRRLWQAPHITAILAVANVREAKGDTSEAWQLFREWYREQGEPVRTYGPESEITQFLMTDKGVNDARQEFREGGCKDMVENKRHEYKFSLFEYATQLYEVASTRDWSGSFLGGYEVQIENLGNNEAKITVINYTGWSSATHVPETPFGPDWWWINDEDRDAPGPGGTLIQYYQWTEEINYE